MTEPVVYQSASPRLELPFLFAGQVQREFFVNESLARLDVVAHAAIEGVASEPPAEPGEGQCWLVGADATGAWAGHDDAIAGWIAGQWTIVAPVAGMRMWDGAAHAFLHFDEGWQRPLAPALPDGGTTADAEARAAIGNLIETLTAAGIFSVA